MRRINGLLIYVVIALATSCSNSTGSSPNPIAATGTSAAASPTAAPIGIPIGGGNPTASPTAAASASATATATASAAAPTPAATTSSCSEESLGTSVRFVCTNDVQNTAGTVQNTYLADYYGDNADTANNSAPFATEFYYQSTAPGLNPSGSVIASESSVLTDSPVPLASSGDSIGFGFAQQFTSTGNEPITSSGESFTCTLYDGMTELGTAQATVYSSTSNNVTTNELGCFADYAETQTQTAGNAYITLANGSYNPGDTYTMVLSH